MPGNFKVTFSDKVGLQWTVEFCPTGDFKTDAKQWMRIHQLWNRISEPAIAECYGQRLDGGPDPPRYRSHSEIEDIGWIESYLGVSG